MKIRLLVFLLSISFGSFGQISVGSRHVGKDELQKFKNTETIFVLSEALDRYDYLRILEDSWHITPYQIVHIGDFNIEKYLNGKYSIAKLGGHIKYTSMGNGGYSSLYTYINFLMYDGEKILKKLSRLSPKKKEKKKTDIIEDNSQTIARFYLYPKDDFIHTSMSKGIEETYASLYLDDIFYNYKPGFLKNYFQEVNNLIKDEKKYSMYDDYYDPKLKKLTSENLYIPSYMTIEYNGWTGQDSEEDEENIQEVLEKYDFQFEIIDDSELSDKIMDNEELYYLRYVRVNTLRFLQVVNSRKGEIVYNRYITGFSYKIKSKHIKDLNKDITKASRK